MVRIQVQIPESENKRYIIAGVILFVLMFGLTIYNAYQSKQLLEAIAPLQR